MYGTIELHQSTISDVHPVNMIDERRKFPRLSLPLDIKINNIKTSSDIQHDISEEGVCFETSHNFAENDFIFFHFNGKESSNLEGKKFSILGKVVWCKTTNGDMCKKYGVQFKFYNDPFSNQQRDTMRRILHTGREENYL